MSTHLKDLPAFIDGMYSLLRPGGKIVVFDWMAGSPKTPGNKEARIINAVIRTMLMQNIETMAGYADLLRAKRYEVLFSENTSDKTFKTWKDAATGIRSSLKMLVGANPRKLLEMITFVRGVRAMRIAMEKKVVQSGIIIAFRPAI